MKKLILLPLILIGLLGCSNNVPYTVDTPIHELNGLSLNDLFKDSASKLGDYQLLNNPDFKTDTNNDGLADYWYKDRTNNEATLTNNIQRITANGDNRVQLDYNTINFLAFVQYYIYFDYDTNITTTHLSITTTDFTTILPSTTSTGTISGLYNSTTAKSGFRFRMYRGAGLDPNDYFEFDKVYIFNTYDLIGNNYYSPIYKTTLNNLNNNQIQVQMDSWINTGLSTDIWSYDDLLNIYDDLTLSQLVRFYDDYITLSRVPLSSQTTFSRDDIIILVIALILYLGGMFLAVKTNTQWLITISGLLWFVPIYIIPNIFIIIFSITMMIFSFIVSYTKREE
jgi:hypothetical protein